MEAKFGFLLMPKNEFRDWLNEQTIDRVIDMIQNHHTFLPDYTLFNGNNHFLLLKGMRDYHINSNNWDDIGQNITTFPDGRIAICRSLSRPPAGIKGHNSKALCLEHLGNFDAGKDQMKAEHKDTIIHTNAALCHKFTIQRDINHIVYHHWYDQITCERTDGAGTTKSCPGTAFMGGNSVESASNKFIPLIVDEYMSFTPDIAPSRNNQETLEYGMVTASELNIRNGPATNYIKVGYLNNGAVINIYGRLGQWYRISGDEKWISAKYVRIIRFGLVTVPLTDVMTSPDLLSRKISILPSGSKVTIYEESNGWYRIDLNDKWVKSGDIETVNP
jgi:SH3-like domain-containing protein